MEIKNKFLEIPRFENHERFLSKIKYAPDNDCWNWGAFINNVGYGTFSITIKKGDTRKFYAHRVSFNIFNAKIKNGLLIDHMCMNRKCVNPEHLRQVNGSVNSRENVNRKKINSCSRGHVFVDGSYYLTKKGQRSCRECIKINMKKFRSSEFGKKSRKIERAKYKLKKKNA